MMALAYLDMVLVQARYHSSQQETGIALVSMETAKEEDLMLDVAFAIEDCRCPDGYKGYSCEVWMGTDAFTLAVPVFRLTFNLMQGTQGIKKCSLDSRAVDRQRNDIIGGLTLCRVLTVGEYVCFKFNAV